MFSNFSACNFSASAFASASCSSAVCFERSSFLYLAASELALSEAFLYFSFSALSLASCAISSSTLGVCSSFCGSLLVVGSVVVLVTSAIISLPLLSAFFVVLSTSCDICIALSLGHIKSHKAFLPCGSISIICLFCSYL